MRWPCRALPLTFVVLSACAETSLPPPPTVAVAGPAPASPPSAEVAAAPKPEPEPAPSPPAGQNPCAPGTTIPTNRLREPFKGAFSGPGRDEMVATMTCEPDEDGLGGEALLRHEGDAWKMVSFWPRLNHRITRGDCKTLRTAEGRDLAVCTQTGVNSSETAVSVIVIDYAQRGEDAEDAFLISLHDNSGSACTGIKEVVVQGLAGFEIVDVDRDGTPDVRVKLYAAKTRIPRQPPCDKPGAFAGPRLPQPPVQTAEFLTRGTKFVPTPGTARLLKSLSAMVPQG